jgi:hypothetical protein
MQQLITAAGFILKDHKTISEIGHTSEIKLLLIKDERLNDIY